MSGWPAWATIPAALLLGVGLSRFCLAGGGRALIGCVAALLGLGFASGSYAVAVVLRLPGGAAGIAFTLAMAGAGAAALAAAPRAERNARPDPFPGPLRKACFALCGAAALAAAGWYIEHTLRWPDAGWDAWAFWNTRARYFVRGGIEQAFSPLLWHADYPFLVPGLVAQGWMLTGGENFGVPGAIAFLFMGLAAAVPALACAGLRGAAAGALMAGLLLATPSFHHHATSQYSDVPLAAFLAAALAAVALALEGPTEARFRRLALAGVLGSMAAWCKNEGSLAVLALGVGVVARPGPEGLRTRIRDAAWAAAGAFPFCALLAAYKLTTAGRNDIVAGFSVAGALELRRYALMAKYAGKLFLDFHDWGLTMIAAPLAAWGAWRARPHPPSAGVAALTLALTAAGFVAIYAVTPLDPAWHIDTSYDRLASQLLPSALFLASLTALARP